MTKNRFFGCLLALALLAGAFTLGVPETAQALPSNEVTTTYYSDASKTDVVGERILLCSGGWISWGIKTSYATQYSVSCNEF